MLKPCGTIEACSPRGPKYSGKLIARAIELYNHGVKSGYIRWEELHLTLEKEFPSEFTQLGEDRPSPETVIAWVRKYPDAPERLKQLRVQQADPYRWQSYPINNPATYQSIPSSPMPASYADTLRKDINTLSGNLVAFLAVAMMVRFAWFLNQS